MSQYYHCDRCMKAITVGVGCAEASVTAREDKKTNKFDLCDTCYNYILIELRTPPVGYKEGNIK